MTALDDVTVEFGRGRLTAIMGPSGSGKSTLMHCMAGAGRPDLRAGGHRRRRLGGLKDKALTLLRRDRLGFVFQAYNLVPTLTARENITLPVDIAGRDARPGVVRHGRRHPGHPGPALATGPTSSPAASSSGSPAPGPWSAGPRSSSPTSPPATWTRAPAPRSWPSCARRSTTSARRIVMVTHDPVAASYADRVLFLVDGRIVDEMRRPTADDGPRADEGLRARRSVA